MLKVMLKLCHNYYITGLLLQYFVSKHIEIVNPHRVSSSGKSVSRQAEVHNEQQLCRSSCIKLHGKCTILSFHQASVSKLRPLCSLEEIRPWYTETRHSTPCRYF